MKVKEYIENFNTSEEIKKDMEEFTKKCKKEKIDDKTEKYIEEFIKRYNIDYKQKDNIKKLIKNYNIFDTKKEEKSDFNEHEININGLDRNRYNIIGLDEYGLDEDGYSINGLDRNGLDRNGYNINGVEGTRKKYPKRKVNYKEVDDGLYARYGFNSEGFNKDGYKIYGFNRIGFYSEGFNSEGFNIDGLNKDGLNKFGYTKKLGKGLNISALPILLSKIYANNTIGPS